MSRRMIAGLATLTLAGAALPQTKRPAAMPAPKPFLATYCQSCHSGAHPAGGVALRALESPALQERVRLRVGNGTMPPRQKGVAQPTVAERTAFLKAVAPASGVTLRRLNRLEYRNTIHDLVGVSFDPTTTFPSDEVGYGFDNIGEVLMLSPILMERYLAASEEIMARAITPVPPPIPKRYTGAIFTEPGSDISFWGGNWRWIASDSTNPIELGPIATSFQWEDDGDYKLQVRAYGQSGTDQPVKLAVLMRGPELTDLSPESERSRWVGAVGKAKIVATLTVNARSREKAEVLELKLPPLAHRREIAFALEKPAAGAPPAKVWLEYFIVEGPTETRPPSHFRLLATSPAATTPAAKTREVLTRFLTRAFRRPVTPQELAATSALVERRMADGASWESAVQFAMSAALCSPKFLYREVTPPDAYALASRLSYFLWSTMPDDELFTLAQRGQLSANLEAQVKRMLASPRAHALVESFAMQWLQLQRLERAAPDSQLFPAFNAPLRAAMREETEQFVAAVFRDDRSVLELIDADYTYLNAPLAKHYGITLASTNLPAETFRRVALTDRTRGGLLTQASVLTVTSNPTRTSPVKRGKWVLEQILGAPPPPPPPNVPELPEKPQDADAASLRQRLEVHRRNPTCANCHTKMDSLGFALENFDAVGAFRIQDGRFPVDATGTLADGTRFTGPAELKRFVLRRKEEFVRCLTEKLMIYALGRGLEPTDRPVVEHIVAAAKAKNYRFSALVTEIVLSEPFRRSRGERIK